jgi:hypothetical protein
MWFVGGQTLIMVSEHDAVEYTEVRPVVGGFLETITMIL